MYAGGVAMSVKERKYIFDMAINEYGFTKVILVSAGTLVAAVTGAIVGFAVCVNVIPNKSENVDENEKESK